MEKISMLFAFQGSSLSFTSSCPDDLSRLCPTLAGTPAVTDGLWVVIPPPSKGDHILELAGHNGQGFALDFSISFTA